MASKMLLIFYKTDVEKMMKGEVGVWCAHGAMWLEKMFNEYLRSSVVMGNNKYGYFEMGNWDLKSYNEWLNTDYRKIVLVSDIDLETLFSEVSEADDLELPCYLQYSAHDGKPKCLAVFGDEKILDEWTKDMGLLK